MVYNVAQLVQSVEKTLKIALEFCKLKESNNPNQSDAFASLKLSEVIGVSAQTSILLKVLDKISEIQTMLSKDSKAKEGKLDELIIGVITDLATLKAYLESKKS